MACPDNYNYTSTDFGCIPNFDPGAFTSKFYTIGLGVVGSISILFIIYGGYLILFSQGNTMTLQKGKRYLTYAIFGLLLAIFGFVFIQVIAVDILHLPGFNT